MSKTNKKHDGILNNAVKINLNHFDKTHFLDNWILIITNYARGFLFFLLTIVKLLTVGFGFFLLSILISGVYVGFNKTLVDVQALHCKGYLFDLLNTLPIQLLSDHRDFVVYGDIEQLEIQFPYEMRILNDVKAIYYARDEYTAYYKVKTPILLGASNTKIINKGKVVSVLTHMLGNKVANIYNYDVGSYESLAAFPIIKGNSKFPNDRLINENDINYKYNLKTGIKICENIEHLVRFIIKEGFSEKMMKYFEDRIDKLSMMLTDLLKVLGSDVPGIDPPNESQIIKLANVLPALTIFISIVGYLSITMMMRAFENDDRILVIGWFFLYAVSAILTIVLSTALLKFTSFISITISFTLLLVSCFRYMVHHDYETQKERMDRINHFKKNSTPSDIPSTKRLLYFVVFFSLLASYYSFPVISDLPVFFLNAIKIFINRIASSNFTIVASNKIKYILPYESFEYMTSGYVNFLKYLSEHLPIQDYIGSITYDSIQSWKAYFFYGSSIAKVAFTSTFINPTSTSIGLTMAYWLMLLRVNRVSLGAASNKPTLDWISIIGNVIFGPGMDAKAFVKYVLMVSYVNLFINFSWWYIFFSWFTLNLVYLSKITTIEKMNANVAALNTNNTPAVIEFVMKTVIKPMNVIENSFLTLAFFYIIVCYMTENNYIALCIFIMIMHMTRATHLLDLYFFVFIIQLCPFFNLILMVVVYCLFRWFDRIGEYRIMPTTFRNSSSVGTDADNAVPTQFF